MQVHARLLHAVPDLEGRERVDVEVGQRLLKSHHKVTVVGARHFRVQPALEAHLGAATHPRLASPSDHGLDGQPLGPRILGALGKTAEAATHIADVGEVDVAVDDEGHVVTHRLPAQLVGHRDHGVEIGAARGEKGRALGLGDLAPLERPVKDMADGSGGGPGQQHQAALTCASARACCAASPSPRAMAIAFDAISGASHPSPARWRG